MKLTNEDKKLIFQCLEPVENQTNVQINGQFYDESEVQNLIENEKFFLGDEVL